MKENILGTEKISKLMLKFSLPCIVSMLVNSLYNIVDQVFIGWGVGYLGNGATNVVFPITVITLAFALMIGDGSSAFLSLKLGEKKEDVAAKGVGNGIITGAIISILFAVIALLFLPSLLNLFGCTDALRSYAKDYGYIIALGIPFMMLGVILNSVIRADGSPKYSMLSMVSGAALNIVLDPLFIFAFHMGVKGAALATIISQIVSFIINISYIRKCKSIKIDKEKLSLDFKVVTKILALGISSFITQMSIVFVIAVENNLLTKYGAMSKFGEDIPITVMGIVMKISQILNSIILGLSVGAQPILGYNYGAGKYDRVKKTLKIVLVLSVMVSTIAFLLFQLVPDKLILIFGGGDDLYIKFATMSFRIYLLLIICTGIQMPSGIFFQAIGKSGRSALLSISRQVLFLVPAMIIFGQLFGLSGILFAGPFADFLAFLLSSVFLIKEVKSLGRVTHKSEALIDDTSDNNILNKHLVITIGREYGSGGRYVGRLVADELGIKFYDKEFITKLASKTGYSEEFIESNEQKLSSIELVGKHDNANELFISESSLIKELSEKESCVIIGRCADYVLKDNKDVFKVFIYSHEEDKINRAVKYYGLDEKKAAKIIKKNNKLRANHYKTYTGRNWNDPNNFDLCINSDMLGVEKTAELICSIVKKDN